LAREAGLMPGDSVNFDPVALHYNQVAAAYEAGRPGYRDDIVDAVAELLEAEGPGPVLDLAAGTGKFTRRLRGAGPILAAEPVRAMAHQLRTVLPDVPCVRAYAGRLPLAEASLAGITVAQAFQWFDQSDMPELARVLRPRGLLALVWNRRQSTAAWEAVSPVIDEFRPGPRRRVDAPTMLERSGAFGPVEVEQWAWVRTVTRVELQDHVQSLSWIAALPVDDRAAIAADIDVALGDGEVFRLDYVSELVHARRR
jgi:SAM-dependent methyltransferase